MELTKEQVESYHTNGFLAVHDVIPAEYLLALRTRYDELILEVPKEGGPTPIQEPAEAHSPSDGSRLPRIRVR